MWHRLGVAVSSRYSCIAILADTSILTEYALQVTCRQRGGGGALTAYKRLSALSAGVLVWGTYTKCIERQNMDESGNTTKLAQIGN